MTISTSDFEVLLQKEKRARQRAEEMERIYRQQVRAYRGDLQELETIQRALILTIATQQKEIESMKTGRYYAENAKAVGLGKQGFIYNPVDTEDIGESVAAQEALPRP